MDLASISYLQIIGYALLGLTFGAELRGDAGKKSKLLLHLAWIIMGVELALGSASLSQVPRASALVALLFTTAAWHLYSGNARKYLVLASYLAVLWSIAVTYGGAIYVLWVVHVPLIAIIAIRRGRDSESERGWADGLPVVWQAVILYSMWLWLGTVAALIEGSGEVRPFFLGAPALPAALLVLWSRRHSLLRDGTARSLAHFGVVLLLLGLGASSIWSTTTQMVTGGLELVGLRYAQVLIRWGALLALSGSVLFLAKDK